MVSYPPFIEAPAVPKCMHVCMQLLHIQPNLGFERAITAERPR